MEQVNFTIFTSLIAEYMCMYWTSRSIFSSPGRPAAGSRPSAGSGRVNAYNRRYRGI